jgi:hypothetical protein
VLPVEVRLVEVLPVEVRLVEVLPVDVAAMDSLDVDKGARLDPGMVVPIMPPPGKNRS